MVLRSRGRYPTNCDPRNTSTAEQVEDGVQQLGDGYNSCEGGGRLQQRETSNCHGYHAVGRWSLSVKDHVVTARAPVSPC